MRMLAAAAIGIALLAGCSQQPGEPQREPIEVRTIENTTPRAAMLEPPAVLDDQAVVSPRRAPAAPRSATTTPAEISAEEAMKAKTNLPFTPPIAMDPVDGSKLTITSDTPIYSHKDRWYYFSSEANKRKFVANPEQFLNQALGRF